MPFSYPYFKQEVIAHIKSQIDANSKVLDVGPGAGFYGQALKGYQIDCVEVYAPYIYTYQLASQYNNVYVNNILDFDFSQYDYIILGDVLEHIEPYKAVELIEKINGLHIQCMVAVPYNYEQGAWGGNEHEIHLQPDLTPELMQKRYPHLNLLIGDGQYGYYVNYLLQVETTLTEIDNANLVSVQ